MHVVHGHAPVHGLHLRTHSPQRATVGAEVEEAGMHEGRGDEAPVLPGHYLQRPMHALVTQLHTALNQEVSSGINQPQLQVWGAMHARVRC